MTTGSESNLIPGRAVPDADAERVITDLVATPSVSGEERAAVERFVHHARALGLDASIDAAGNGIATRHAGDANTAPVRTTTVILGHIDTVPGDIPVRVEGRTLHGRGSVDAKGPLAAGLVAAASADLPEGARVIVVAAVGEETSGSPGARFVRDEFPNLGIHPDACIVTEPSGWDGVTLGYKGRLLVNATIVQPEGHSAGPHGSAADAALAWWSSVLRVVALLNTGHTGAFDTIQSSVHTVSTKSDGLHESATVRAGFRLPTWITPTELEHAVRLARNSESPEDCGADWDFAFEGHEFAHASDRSDAVARALSSGVRAAGGKPRPKLKTGTADMNVVAPKWRCPIAAYGPGDSSLDHTPIEHLDLDEYLRSVAVLRHALRAIAAERIEAMDRADASPPEVTTRAVGQRPEAVPSELS